MLNAVNTLPAKLNPATSFLGRGKALVSFYKSGIVNIWSNRRLARDIRSRFDANSSYEIAQAVVENRHLINIGRNFGTEKNFLTRKEFLTVTRTERDLFKLPIFACIFAVCFELTPLVLYVFPRVAPSTCWSLKYTRKLEDRYTNLLKSAKELRKGLDGSESVFRLNYEQLQTICKALNLIPILQFAPSVLIPASLLRSKILKHLVYVRADDALLNGHDLKQLNENEVSRALMARLLPLDGGIEALSEWLERFKEPMDAGFFLK